VGRFEQSKIIMKESCKNCKWWDKDVEEAYDERGRCLKAVESWSDKSEESPMVTLDGSQYMALLLTKPDFGCILFDN